MRVPPDQSGTAAARRSRASVTLPGAAPGARVGEADELGVEREDLGSRGAARRQRQREGSAGTGVWASMEPLVSQSNDEARLLDRARAARQATAARPGGAAPAGSCARRSAQAAARAWEPGAGCGAWPAAGPAGPAAAPWPRRSRADQSASVERACAAAGPPGCTRAARPRARPPSRRSSQPPRRRDPSAAAAARRSRGRLDDAAAAAAGAGGCLAAPEAPNSRSKRVEAPARDLERDAQRPAHLLAVLEVHQGQRLGRVHLVAQAHGHARAPRRARPRRARAERQRPSRRRLPGRGHQRGDLGGGERLEVVPVLEQAAQGLRRPTSGSRASWLQASAAPASSRGSRPRRAASPAGLPRRAWRNRPTSQRQPLAAPPGSGAR